MLPPWGSCWQSRLRGFIGLWASATSGASRHLPQRGRISGLALALTLAAVTPALARPPADPAPIVAAERAFAADGLALGIKASFLKHMAPEAIIFAPGPVKARDFYGARPDRKGPALVWWPLWAGIARSGDLGFTTGPFTLNGKPGGDYFTVWKRQADGGWAWIYDGGTDSLAVDAPPAGTTPGVLAAASGRRVYPEHAVAEVKTAETRLAEAAKTDLRAAYGVVLAPDARMQGSPAVPAATPDAVRAELATRAPQIAFRTLGAESSKGGDLAWTYGEAAWTRDGTAGSGHYVRIWRRDRGGWRVVFDQIIPDPPPKG
jgi:ketosteroid isomerase-like protein